MILDGAVPRLIDEWQLIPKIWDYVRNEIDRRSELGQFILTGSAVPPNISDIAHTGTGRITRLLMRPMTLWESGDSNGTVSLKDLFNEPQAIAARNQLTLKRIAFLLCRGGWPFASLLTEDDIALDQAIDYFEAVINSDIQRIDNTERNPRRARRLLRSYARFQGTSTAITNICRDLKTNEGGGMDETTVSSYLNALRKIFVIEDMPAWNPNLRSGTAIRTTDTRYFVDPSIATAALGAGPEDLLNDLKTFGLLFETLCVRDLRVYAQVIDGEVFHFRDKNGLECDAVIHLRNGAFGLVEIKLGGEKWIDDAARSLRSLSSKIDTERMAAPSFMAVVTATGDFAYRREDGVYVVPIGCLKD